MASDALGSVTPWIGDPKSDGNAAARTLGDATWIARRYSVGRDRGAVGLRRAGPASAAPRCDASDVAGEAVMSRDVPPADDDRRPDSPARRIDTASNLLLGLLAFQNNFIDRDALLGAFTGWLADRSRGLGQILLDRGALSPTRRQLLEALVEEHIRFHGDDPEKSLAALSSIGSVRDDLSRVADDEVQDSLAHVSAARKDQDDDPYRTVTQSLVGDSTSAGTRFRILRPHAKGGLGEVFVALDTELNRDVALKEIQDHFADDPRYRARFEFEAEVTGGLEHPGIVPVYGLGHTPDGRPFYAMRFIKGNSLKEAIRRFHEAEKQSTRDPGLSTLELRELLGRFIDVCDAVAYAHSRRVLHRDLKPGNIMLGKYGETLVVDWGLAKALDEPEAESPIEQPEAPLKPASGSALEQTIAGSAVGTPAYMSPEQVDGRVGKLGVRSDVYCLGATLYHLLTGHAPCEAGERGDIYQKVLAGDISRPRSLNPRVAPALEAICLKALALKPRDRYESAELLKADLERWLADEPVTAWREPFAVQARRWARRNRTSMTAAAVALVVGVIGLSAVAIVQSRSNSALEAKNLQLTEANAATTNAKNEAESALTETGKAKRETEEALAQKGAALVQSEESRQRAEAVLKFLKDDVLAATRPEGEEGGLGRDVTVRKAIDAAEPKIAGAFQDQPIVEAEVRNTLGDTYYYLGDSPLAVRQYERAVELRESRLGPDHPDTLNSRNNLAVVYGRVGRADDAIKMHEETLKRRETKLGPDHSGTLLSRINLATSYQVVGRTEDAIKMHEETLRRQQAKFGPDHFTTMSTRNNLAAAYRASGRTNDAIKMLEAVAKQRESQLGPDHPDTLMSRSNLAEAYDGAGRTDDAIRIQEATLKLYESKLGRDHPDTLISRGLLALAYRTAGQVDHAISLLEETLRGFRAKVGPDHPHTLTCERYLVDAYTAAGQYTRAESLLRDALERARKRFGPSDPRTAGAMVTLGLNLIQQRKWAEAEPVLRECLAIHEKDQPGHWRTFNTRSQLGGSLLGQKRFAEAEPLIFTGYEGMKAREVRIPALGKPRLAEAAERVVRLYESWDKPEKRAGMETKARASRPPRRRVRLALNPATHVLPEFRLFRSSADFQLLRMELAFPAKPFAGRDRSGPASPPKSGSELARSRVTGFRPSRLDAAAIPDLSEQQAELMAMLDPGIPGVAQLGRIGRPHVLDTILLARQAEDGPHDHHALLLGPAGRRHAGGIDDVEALAVGVMDVDAASVDGQPGGRALAFEVIDDDRDVEAVRALLGLAPPAGLVGRGPDGAIRLAPVILDLEPALAALPTSDRVVVDRGIQAEVVRLDELARPCAGVLDRLDGRGHDLRAHVDSGAHAGLLG